MIYVKYYGECFHLIVLVAQQSAVLLAFWREIQPTDVCKVNVLKSSYRKIAVNILTAR